MWNRDRGGPRGLFSAYRAGTTQEGAPGWPCGVAEQKEVTRRLASPLPWVAGGGPSLGLLFQGQGSQSSLPKVNHYMQDRPG